MEHENIEETNAAENIFPASGTGEQETKFYAVSQEEKPISFSSDFSAESSVPKGNHIAEEARIKNKYSAIGVWSYIAGFIVFLIPLAGIILPLIWACAAKNVNRRNFGAALIIVRLIFWTVGAVTLLIATTLFSDLLFTILG